MASRLEVQQYLLSVGVMLPLIAVLSAAWIEVEPVTCRKKVPVNVTVKIEVFLILF